MRLLLFGQVDFSLSLIDGLKKAFRFNNNFVFVFFVAVCVLVCFGIAGDAD